jgi:hypothetical protein
MRKPHRKLLISVVAPLLLLAGLAGYARADSIVASESFEGPGLPLGWTLTGTGGVSGAVTGLAPTQGQQFAWIDTGPSGSASAFYPSILESPSFSITSGQTVSADVNFMSDDFPRYEDYSTVWLVSGNSIVATLFSAQAGCGNGSFDPDLLPPSAGVTLTPANADFQGNLVGPLDGVTYGPQRRPLACPGFPPLVPGGSMGWVTTSYSPAPGTYQLVFEVANAVDNEVPSALAVDDVRITTPEPRTLALLLIGLAGLCILQARRRSRYASGSQIL